MDVHSACTVSDTILVATHARGDHHSGHFFMATNISFLGTSTHFQMEKLRFGKARSPFPAHTAKLGSRPRSARLDSPRSSHSTLLDCGHGCT